MRKRADGRTRCGTSPRSRAGRRRRGLLRRRDRWQDPASIPVGTLSLSARATEGSDRRCWHARGRRRAGRGGGPRRCRFGLFESCRAGLCCWSGTARSTQPSEPQRPRSRSPPLVSRRCQRSSPGLSRHRRRRRDPCPTPVLTSQRDHRLPSRARELIGSAAPITNIRRSAPARSTPLRRPFRPNNTRAVG